MKRLRKRKVARSGHCTTCNANVIYDNYEALQRVWHCPKCNATGTEISTLTFEGHLLSPSALGTAGDAFIEAGQTYPATIGEILCPHRQQIQDRLHTIHSLTGEYFTGNEVEAYTGYLTDSLRMIRESIIAIQAHQLQAGDRREAVYKPGATTGGSCYKDFFAFHTRADVVCYIPQYGFEMVQTMDEKAARQQGYTRNEILRLCHGFESVAEAVFYAADWQIIEAIIEELDDAALKAFGITLAQFGAGKEAHNA